MQIYPYNYPLILTEDTYLQYGGQTGTMSSVQLQAAFVTAETRVSKYIGTFLLPTIVTGTYPYSGSRFVVTDYGYVSEILAADVLYTNGSNCELSVDSSGCAFIRNDTFGYLDYLSIDSQCACSSQTPPYQFRIAYEAGLPTGTASHPSILQALTVVANDAVNSMIFPTQTETSGDRAVLEWGSIDYSEKRKNWAVTALGSSARAGLAADLIKSVLTLARPAIMLR